MNKHIIDLIVNRRLLEKKRIIDKEIIRINLENIILHFDKYSKAYKKTHHDLLNNICIYTKIIKLDYNYLFYFYKNVVNPLLNDKNIKTDINFLSNIIYTFKKNEKCNHILKELSDYILLNLHKNEEIVKYNTKDNNMLSNDLNTWINIIHVLSKYKDINIIEMLQKIIIQEENNLLGTKEYIINTNTNKKIDISYPKNNFFFCVTPYKHNVYNNIYHDKNIFFSLKKINYKLIETLTPRTFSILLNILTKIPIEPCTKFNIFLISKIKNMLNDFSNIDLCLIFEKIYHFKGKDENFYLLYNIIYNEILKRIQSLDLLQICLIFNNLKKNHNLEHQMNTFISLFIKKIKKYYNLYKDVTIDKDKYILFTKDKKCLIEMMPMFFLSYIKNSPHIFPSYNLFSTFVRYQFLTIYKYILYLKNNISLQKQNGYKKTTYNYHYIPLNNINQTLCNFFYAYSGYMYNTLSTNGCHKHKYIYIQHFYITLNNIYTFLYFFKFLYENNSYYFKNCKHNFLLSIHKSQLLIFFYTFWSYIFDILLYISKHPEQQTIKITNKKKNAYIYSDKPNYSIFNDIQKYLLENKKNNHHHQTLSSFFSYIIKLSYLKKIYCILNLLDSTNLEHLMKESLKYKNTYISSIYKNIIDTLNSTQDPNTKTCYLFRRKIIGPYTASVLVQK
ncbi:hypothetical protein PFBG_04225 [Plasmodium falciparum 7G8]|uniref:Uncharacterized protein n=8 Tax=Plasmodium falciparum TaxID=5833 RepID=Q8I4U4_PLAF7|nr:conserved Plasmodium membrane protein, unknown function [Plasmodium falciparum 3D7]ETW29817.1 hypothetical protein PFFCH_02784 [Plasmodium falciparum FCH/4]ETW35175.1 hypothetical protein PFTANZ_04138 [Plasmodium falciparum Tanzania (2000708)]ETW41337.1 hypothetical protein PFNF135_04322 [Plasmodium falciparum NF135/5.C10]ETW47918.1 hypothetical protein PFMALIP_04039 [Plasmodium falciparum MaliPS096_E11]EUR67545.1 hypothetical protein PFBG_04225 [Plasmodium falciparum 7G8]EWC87227.1 hypoth|eukprot:XP_001350874.1 conserved Plasmodium membrane protein, unknown function [Plasmodium falciparum 3D7]